MKKLLLVLAFAVLVLGPGIALSHSGGTDINGCHTVTATGERHCHPRIEEDEDDGGCGLSSSYL